MSTTCRILIFLFVFSEGVSLPAIANQAPSAQTMASPPFYKTSFDCAKAKELSTEAAICKNEELAELDLETAEAYGKRLRAATATEKNRLILSQRQWLLIRNSYNVNPYHGDPAGALSDLADFYRSRVAALQSGRMDLLETKIPQEYDWLIATAPNGFSKQFSISRAYVSCEDPCKARPSLRRWISIAGGGIGPEPGDVDTPYATLVRSLASEGWSKCRSADDSGKPTIDYFRKNDKMAAVSRYYSMGAGNGIGLAITISGPLPENTPKVPPNPAVSITADWITYSDPDVGLQVQYPPTWRMRDHSPTNSGREYKYLLFAAKDYTGDFRITVQPEGMVNHRPINIDNDDPAPKCSPSRYRISGFPARQCLLQYENVSDGTCRRYVEFLDVETGKYHMSFEPSGSGSFDDGSGRYRLTDLYEKIMSTIKFKQN